MSEIVSRPAICARLARLAARVSSSQGTGADRVIDLEEPVKERQQASVSKYASTSKPITPAHGEVGGRMRARGEKAHGGTMSPVGWPHAAYGDQPSEGKYHLGYVIGFTPSALSEPCHLLRLASKFARKLANSSLGGEVCAFSEMSDHVTLLRDFYAPFADLSPDTISSGGCGNLFAHLCNEGPSPRGTSRAISREYSGLSAVMNWVVSIGYQERRTHRMSSPRKRAIW